MPSRDLDNRIPQGCSEEIIEVGNTCGCFGFRLVWYWAFVDLGGGDGTGHST